MRRLEPCQWCKLSVILLKWRFATPQPFDSTGVHSPASIKPVLLIHTRHLRRKSFQLPPASNQAAGSQSAGRQIKVHQPTLHKSMLTHCSSFIQRTHIPHHRSLDSPRIHHCQQSLGPWPFPRTIQLRSSPEKIKMHMPRILYVYTALSSLWLESLPLHKMPKLCRDYRHLYTVLFRPNTYAILKCIFSR